MTNLVIAVRSIGIVLLGIGLGLDGAKFWCFCVGASFISATLAVEL